MVNVCFRIRSKEHSSNDLDPVPVGEILFQPASNGAIADADGMCKILSPPTVP